jgi:hypothetical protein
MIDMYEAGKKLSWWQDWRGECVAIVAAGPSAKTAGVEKLQDRIHVIVINESHKLCPWAEILYSCDADWWYLRAKDVKKFPGIKLTLDDPVQAGKLHGIENLHRVKIPKQHQTWVNDLLFDKPGEIGSGGNGGFQMTNLSAQFGATGIALIGFDMNANGQLHWHGMHPQPLRNPDPGRFNQWRMDFEKNAPKFLPHGIDVVNCSNVSALTSFPKMTVDQMFERWGL